MKGSPAISVLLVVSLVAFLSSSIEKIFSDHQQERELALDPRSITLKKDYNAELPKERVLMENGTWFLPVYGGRMVSKPGPGVEIKNLCKEAPEFHSKIARIHVHNDYCSDESLGNCLPLVISYQQLAHSMGVPFTFTCGEVSSRKAVMGIMQIDEPSPDFQEQPSYPLDLQGNPFTLKDFCAIQKQDGCAFWICPQGGLENANDLIVQNMKKIASTPLGQSFEPDDAVIHVRLGDVMQPVKKKNKPSARGLFAHSAYRDILLQVQEEKGPIRSISLVTSPLDERVTREKDLPFLEISQKVLGDLAQYLSSCFPDAEVKIHNAVSEKASVAYSRLIRAKKVAVCGCSTFCAFPVMGVSDDAIGYMYKAEQMNYFAAPLADQRENMRVWDAPMLGNNEIRKYDESQVLHFLSDPTLIASAMMKATTLP